MKSVKKHLMPRLLLRAGILIIAIAAGFVIYYLYLLHLGERLTFKITKDVFVINDILTSMYIVESDSGFIAVDTGMDDRMITKGFLMHGIKTSDVKAVLLTHSDYDHVNLLDKFPRAEVYISEAEYRMVDSGLTRFSWLPFYKNSLPERQYHLLKDDEKIAIDGLEVRCILLPGHTQGSMSYLVKGKYLFTGDAFRLKNGKVSLPYKKHIAMDSDLITESIKKLFVLKDIEYIFTANSGFTADYNYAISE